MKRKIGIPYMKMFLGLVCVLMLQTTAQSQIKYKAKDDLNVLVSGTSTLHDWDMKAAKGKCEGLFVFNADGILTDITDLTFEIPVSGLKSGHNGMDQNAYKALKAGKFRTILFTLSKVTIYKEGNIGCIGKLTIAGVTHDIEFTVNYKHNVDRSISISGIKKINMIYFNMEPSTFMGGMFKIGDEVTVKFDLTLHK